MSLRLRYVLEAAGAYLLVGIFFRVIPLRFASALGGFIARVVGPRLKVSDTARDNLRQAYPDKTPAEISRIVRGVWDNLGRNVGEFPHLAKLEDPSLVRLISDYEAENQAKIAHNHAPIVLRGRRHELAGAENLFRMMRHDGPVVCVVAHLGNWEMAPFCSALVGAPITSVFRPPNNPYVARFLDRLRVKNGPIIQARSLGAAARAAGVLGNGGRLGMAADQRVIVGGMVVPFFGRPVLTNQAPARLAIRFSCPIYGVRVIRIRGTAFRIVISPPIEVPKDGPREQRVRSILEQINQEIESWVRETPEQWLWLHRRWEGLN